MTPDLERAYAEPERRYHTRRHIEDCLEKLAAWPGLTEAEIKTLVVNDKWLAALDARIHGEMDRISQALTLRVKELAERYEISLPQLTPSAWIGRCRAKQAICSADNPARVRLCP